MTKLLYGDLNPPRLRAVEIQSSSVTKFESHKTITKMSISENRPCLAMLDNDSPLSLRALRQLTRSRNFCGSHFRPLSCLRRSSLIEHCHERRVGILTLRASGVKLRQNCRERFPSRLLMHAESRQAYVANDCKALRRFWQ